MRHGLPLVCVLGLLGCHGDPTAVQPSLGGASIFPEASAGAGGTPLAPGHAVSVRTLPFYKSKEFRQLLSDAGVGVGYVQASALWPYPLPAHEVFAAKADVKLSNGTTAALGSVLELSDAELVPGKSVVVKDGLAVATVEPADIRSKAFEPSEWKEILVDAVKQRRWSDIPAAAQHAGVLELTHLTEDQLAGIAEGADAGTAISLPQLEWNPVKSDPALAFVRTVNSRVLSKPGGETIAVLPFGSSVQTEPEEKKGWRSVTFDAPAELELDPALKTITFASAPQSGEGVVATNELTAINPNLTALRAAVTRYTQKADPVRALNALAYLHLLKRDAWDELVDASFKAGDFKYLRGLVRANLDGLRPVPGNGASNQYPAVRFVAGCRDFVRRGRVSEVASPPEWIAIDGSETDDQEPVDCFDVDLAPPCEVINANQVAQDQLSPVTQRANDAEAAKADRLRDRLLKDIASHAKARPLVGPTGVRINFTTPKDCEGWRFFLYRSTHKAVNTGPFEWSDEVTEGAPFELPAKVIACDKPVAIWIPDPLTSSFEYGVLRAHTPEEVTSWLDGRKKGFAIEATLFGPVVVASEALRKQVSGRELPAEPAPVTVIAWGLSRVPAGDCGLGFGFAQDFIKYGEGAGWH